MTKPDKQLEELAKMFRRLEQLAEALKYDFVRYREKIDSEENQRWKSYYSGYANACEVASVNIHRTLRGNCPPILKGSEDATVE